jgi:hypothetical protein
MIVWVERAVDKDIVIVPLCRHDGILCNQETRCPPKGRAALPLDDVTPRGGLALLLDLPSGGAHLAGPDGARPGRAFDSSAHFGHVLLRLHRSHSAAPYSTIILR